MKIQVVVPDEAYLAQAGVRIRYERIAGHLAAAGHEIGMQPIDELRTADKLDGDVYLFSKCYDARSYVVASAARIQGKLVGIDLFDDYFSQVADSRFVRQRSWLRTIARWCDFVLCSTPRMREVASRSAPGVPAHILNDPHAGLDAERIAATVERNRTRGTATRQVDVAWFGNGDNPHFPVGLRDVHAFAPVLQELRTSGMRPRLRVLTNRRALTADGLEALATLPVPWSVDEWTVEAEAALLEESLVAFIPVNTQPFSTAKSLNRAVSALAAGVQVLTVGYPLYQPLHGFIYRDASSLLSDLERGQLRLRRETLGGLADRFAEWADPRLEAERLAGFLAGTTRQSLADVSPHGRKPAANLAVVHGIRSAVEVHQLTQRHRQLSVGSAYSSEGLNYDVRFSQGPGAGAVQAEIDVRVLDRIRPQVVELLEAGKSRSGRSVRQLPLNSHFPRQAAPIARALASRNSRLQTLATYEEAMAAEFEVLKTLLPDTEFVLSETEAPFGALRA